MAGRLLRTVGLTLAGYALGPHVDNVDHCLLPIVGAVVVVSMLPLLIELIPERPTAPSAEPEPS